MRVWLRRLTATSALLQRSTTAPSAAFDRVLAATSSRRMSPPPLPTTVMSSASEPLQVLHVLEPDSDVTKAAVESVPATAISTSTTTSNKPLPSFYRRPLPSTCVALSSKAGRKRFVSAQATGGLKSFFRLVEQHTTQGEPAFCGVSTLTVCLNAFAVDPRQNWKGPWRWYEESMLNCCVDLEDVKKTGITMSVFHCLARCQGLTSHVYYAEDDTNTVEHFREQVRLACVEAGPSDEDGDEHDDSSDEHLRNILVVSYNRQGLGQTGTGHFSPVGAYDAASDSVLILDTARFKYGVHWVSVPLLYEAMKSIDPDSGRSRGYIMLTHDREEHHQPPASTDAMLVSSALPASILFRTRMRKFETRRQYKDFLRDLGREPSWEDVLQFWTNNYTNRKFVWTALEPRVKPCTNEAELNALIDQVRALMAQLIPSEAQIPLVGETSSSQTSSSCLSKCRPNGLRTLDLKPEEAMYVAYLAALDDDQRTSLVYAADGASDEAKRQLLAEAELVRYAIDVSDQQPLLTEPSINN